MSDDGAVVETSEAAEPEAAPLSVMEHAKLHGEQKAATPDAEKAEIEEKAAHHSEEQKRKQDGKWDHGRVRHRAKSQQASPEDVPRIKELTGRLRAAEDEVTRLKAQHAPPAQIAQAERKVEQAEARPAQRTEARVDRDDPEPTEDDPTYGGDYGKFLQAQARWAARDERRRWQAEEKRQAEAAKVREAGDAIVKSFAERVTAAKARYDDFEAVAFGPSSIPEGSPTDAFVMEDENGADVLYYLHSHLDELSAILQMSALQQLKRLTLLSQRFDQAPSSAETTGAATRHRVVQLPPRPPTPVRTEAQRVSGSPPLDGSLSVAEHSKRFKRA